MSKFISDEEMEKLDPSRPKGFISDEEMSTLDAHKDKPWYSMSGEGIARGAIDAIPAVGAVGGGILGAPVAGPAGAVGGAALGYAGGKELSDFLKNRLLGDKPESVEPLEQAKRVGGNLAEGAGMEMGGQALGVALKAGAEMGKRVGEKASQGLKRAGTSIYKSGLKNIDQMAERYGKEPVSDLLLSKGITGNSREIFNQMDDLGEQLLFERDAILKGATRKGAEVDVHTALKDAQAYVNELRKVDNPETKKAVNMLQARIQMYSNAAAKAPKQVLRTLPTSEFVPEFRQINGYKPASDELVNLPTSKLGTEAKLQNEVLGYDAPTLSAPSHGAESWTPQHLIQKKAGENSRFKKVLNEPILRDSHDKVLGFPQGAKYETKYQPGMDTALRQDAGEIVYGREMPAHYIPGKAATVIDETERVLGPSPIQASSWKTTSANNVDDAAWQALSQSAEGQGFDKALSGGLRTETENSVGRALGDDASGLLRQKNSELGKILTTKDRALMDAEIEGRRNAVTSVDGILSTAPGVLAAKKAADFSKTTWARTKGGKGLIDLSDKIAQHLLKSPQLQMLSKTNPGAFEKLVMQIGARVGDGATQEMSKAAQMGDPRLQDEKAKQSFLEGN